MASALELMDPEIFDAMEKETVRQGDELELIASENYVSEAVLEAVLADNNPHQASGTALEVDREAWREQAVGTAPLGFAVVVALG